MVLVINMTLFLRVLSILIALFVVVVGILGIVAIDGLYKSTNTVVYVLDSGSPEVFNSNYYFSLATFCIILSLGALVIVVVEATQHPYPFGQHVLLFKALMWICIGIVCLGLAGIIGFICAICCFVLAILHLIYKLMGGVGNYSYFSRSFGNSSSTKTTTTANTTTKTTQTKAFKSSSPSKMESGSNSSNQEHKPEVVKGGLSATTYEKQPSWATNEQHKNTSGQYVVGKNTQNKNLW